MDRDVVGRAWYVAAGIADTVLERAEGAARSLRGALRRSDLSDLVADGVADLASRGRIATARVTQSSGPHIEQVAQRAAARLRSDGADA
jgi:hypothetical protein